MTDPSLDAKPIGLKDKREDLAKAKNMKSTKKLVFELSNQMSKQF